MPESRIPRDEDHPSQDPDVLRERAERAEREREILRRENERLRKQVDHLKRQLEEARRAGYRQAAPFAKPLKKHPKRPGRKPGAAYGRPARRRVPSHEETPIHREQLLEVAPFGSADRFPASQQQPPLAAPVGTHHRSRTEE